jgi:hypothetical protein
MSRVLLHKGISAALMLSGLVLLVFKFSNVSAVRQSSDFCESLEYNAVAYGCRSLLSGFSGVAVCSGLFCLSRYEYRVMVILCVGSIDRG